MSTAGARAPRHLRAARSLLLGAALLIRWAVAKEGLAALACDGDALAADPDLQAVLSQDDEFASLLSTKRVGREYFAGGGSSRRERVHQPTYATGVHHKTVPELQSDEEFSKDFVKDNQPGKSTSPPASNETDDVASVVDGAIGGAADAANTVDDTIATTTTTTTTTTTSTSTTTTTTMTTTSTATTTTTDTLDGATGAINSTADAANDTLSSTLSDLCRRYNAPCGALKWLRDALGSTSANDSSEAAGTGDTASTADGTIDSVVNDTLDGATDAVSSAVDAANDTLSSAVDAVSGALKWLTDALESTNANDSNKAGSTSDAASTSEKPETTVTVSADAEAGEEPKHAPGTSRRFTSESTAIWLLMFVLIASAAIVFFALCMLE
jgi:hypothetical protein